MITNVRPIDQIKPLIDYLEKNLNKGYKLEDLKWALISQGHSRVSIEKAMKYVYELRQKQVPKEKELIKKSIEAVEIEEPIKEESWWEKIKNKLRF